jgi:hypothetical protein
MSYVEQVAARIRRMVRANGAAGAVDSPELYMFYALLALTVGRDVTREHVHDAWAAWASIRQPNHPLIRPFHELSEEEQLADEPFRQAIAAVAQEF